LPTKVLWSGVEFSAQGEPQPKPVNHYLPLDLWSSNVGSQVGLDEALGKLNNFYETHSTTPILLCLGSWHPYKVACELLWKVLELCFIFCIPEYELSVHSHLFSVSQTYLATITGLAFHALAPDSLCYIKPKLTTLTHSTTVFGSPTTAACTLCSLV
jgi:hypothetical protein